MSIVGIQRRKIATGTNPTFAFDWVAFHLQGLGRFIHTLKCVFKVVFKLVGSLNCVLYRL